MKRVVTALNGTGKSVFRYDELTPSHIEGSGYEIGAIWATSEKAIIHQPTEDPAGDKQGIIPPPGSSQCLYCTIPASTTTEDQSLSIESIDEGFNLEGDDLMHTTDTIDYGVILNGEIWLELDDGEERLLIAGDSFVQNGTRHAWHNRSDRPATMFVVMMGAERR